MKKALFILLFLASPVLVYADEVTITIRDGDITAFTGIVELAASTTPPVDITPTTGAAVSIPASSLLATLVALDATTTDFDITDLGYFSSFSSFIINCIAVPSGSTPRCFNWTYVVNGTFPQIGIDDTLLHDGDIVYLFFGPPRQTILSTTTVAAGESFTATAQRYDLESGSYVGAAGLTLGVGTANPDFSFTEFATSTSDANGEAIFSMNATGTFSVGIQEDFYFPSVSITIVDAPATTTVEEIFPPTVNPPSTGGGGVVHFQLNVSTALAYLVSKQSADGSFGSPIYSDWAAIAFAASLAGQADPGAPKTLLRNYLLSTTPTLSAVTDYERHAMALMALGINPYSDTPTDYIAHITSAFDGTQIGSPDFENDDIFALFPLLHAGYNADDEIVKKVTAFIIARQSVNGSWIGGVDMTAAAIQTLAPLRSLPSVSEALTKAETYLRTQQQTNGGFGNSFATSWALQAMYALGQSPLNWTSGGLNPNDYLASLQQSDGGLESISSNADARIWATEYAIPASLGKHWSSLLQSFERPVSATGSGSGTVLGVSTSTVATTTSVVATPTPPVATSTPPVATSTLEIIAASTSTIVQKIKPAPKPIVKKATPPIVKKVPEVIPPTPIVKSQIAVASVPSESFLGKIWHAVTSFFAALL